MYLSNPTRAVRFVQPTPSQCLWRHSNGRWCKFKKPSGFGDLSTVAATIQQIEGWAPGTRSYRNNNPGNLMYAGQTGAIGQDAQGFAIFPDYQTGLTALDNQITLDASRGKTISEFTSIYAPASDGNNPTSYAAQIAAAAGLSPSDSLSAAIAGGSGGSSPDLSTIGLPSFDLSSIDFSDPVTIGVTLALGLGLAWVVSK
jgi:hypothetical protein